MSQVFLNEGKSTLILFTQHNKNQQKENNKLLTPTASQHEWRAMDCESFHFFFHGNVVTDWI